MIEKLAVHKEKEFIEVFVPQKQEKIIEVERIVEKIVPPVVTTVERIKEVPYMVEKIIDRLVQIPKVYEVERRVDVPVERYQVFEV